jgi:magnesium chelatase family protein
VPLARSFCVSLVGLESTKILIEADISSSLPAFILVGLPDASLSESPARVRAACKNSKLELPARKITVNLSPASVPKHGSSFDLAIAMAVLSASGLVRKASVERFLHLGELALDGSLRRVRGIIPMVIGARAAGFADVVVPAANRAEAELIRGIRVHAFEHLSEVAILHGAQVEALPGTANETAPVLKHGISTLCFSDVKGQEQAIDAARVAAAGGHHMSLIGAPGCGKTMIAQRLPSILPPLDEAQAIEVASIRSLATGEPQDRLDFVAPYISPHHSSSMAALVGGGSGIPRPGLISRASSGVLFLDEAPEFNSAALEALRQPLESGEIQLARSNFSVKYPARVQMVLAANPCPCGKAGTPSSTCQCTELQKSRYLGRLSGPLLDRIDIQLRLHAARPELVLDASVAPKSSQVLAEEVLHARSRASRRLKGSPWSKNADVPGTYIRQHHRPSTAATVFLDRALSRGQLSMRGYDKCLRLSWTVADLNAHDSPDKSDLATALWLRGVSFQTMTLS